MRGDWKNQIGVMLVALGVMGFVVHQRAVQCARALDDEISAARWTPDDTAFVIEQELAEENLFHAPAPTFRGAQLEDRPVGDFPIPHEGEKSTRGHLQ